MRGSLYITINVRIHSLFMHFSELSVDSYTKMYRVRPGHVIGII